MRRVRMKNFNRNTILHWREGGDSEVYHKNVLRTVQSVEMRRVRDVKNFNRNIILHWRESGEDLKLHLYSIFKKARKRDNLK